MPDGMEPLGAQGGKLRFPRVFPGSALAAARPRRWGPVYRNAAIDGPFSAADAVRPNRTPKDTRQNAVLPQKVFLFDTFYLFRKKKYVCPFYGGTL